MRVLNSFDHVETSWKPILNSFFDREKTVGDGELSQKVAFPAHFDIIYTSCNDHDTPRVVTKVNDRKRSLVTF